MMDYPFSVLGAVREAWKLTRGAKWAFGIPIIFSVFFLYTLFFIINKISLIPAFVNSFFLFLFMIFWISGIAGGLIKIAIERVRGNPISAKMGFRYFSNAISVMIVAMIIFLPQLLSYIIFLMNFSEVSINPMFSMILSPLYYGQIFYGPLAFAFLCLAIPLVVDKKLSVFSAMARSVRATRGHIFKILLLEVVGILLFCSASIPWYLSSFITFHPDFFNAVGYALQYVVLFWLVPFLFLLIGVVYHYLEVRENLL